MSRSRAGRATSAKTPRGRAAIQIVVTPGSGACLALRTARRLATLLRRRGRESRLRTFGNLAALRRWAETCKPDFSHLVCVGGDATMSAAAQAAIRLDLPFLAIPQGFGNVFTRTFRYPDRPTTVVRKWLICGAAVLLADRNGARSASRLLAELSSQFWTKLGRSEGWSVRCPMHVAERGQNDATSVGSAARNRRRRERGTAPGLSARRMGRLCD